MVIFTTAQQPTARARGKAVRATRLGSAFEKARREVAIGAELGGADPKSVGRFTGFPKPIELGTVESDGLEDIPHSQAQRFTLCFEHAAHREDQTTTAA